eukprot:m.45806 g.45806  ORF g.45806 m.45806 type:complete len:168 (-) comp14701_c0_seq2:37-540(-)
MSVARKKWVAAEEVRDEASEAKPDLSFLSQPEDEPKESGELSSYALPLTLTVLTGAVVYFCSASVISPKAYTHDEHAGHDFPTVRGFLSQLVLFGGYAAAAMAAVVAFVTYFLTWAYCHFEHRTVDGSPTKLKQWHHLGSSLAPINATIAFCVVFLWLTVSAHSPLN